MSVIQPEFHMTLSGDIHRLGGNERAATLLSLVRFVTSVEGEYNDRYMIGKDVWWRASHADIAESLGGGASHDAIRRAVEKLEAAGELESCDSPNAPNGDQAKLYRIAPTEQRVRENASGVSSHYAKTRRAGADSACDSQGLEQPVRENASVLTSQYAKTRGTEVDSGEDLVPESPLEQPVRENASVLTSQYAKTRGTDANSRRYLRENAYSSSSVELEEIEEEPPTPTSSSWNPRSREPEPSDQPSNPPRPAPGETRIAEPSEPLAEEPVTLPVCVQVLREHAPASMSVKQVARFHFKVDEPSASQIKGMRLALTRESSTETGYGLAAFNRDAKGRLTYWALPTTGWAPPKARRAS